jgi:Ca-activated chloride channel family protein
MNAHRLTRFGLIGLLIGCSTKNADIEPITDEQYVLEEEQVKEKTVETKVRTEIEFTATEIPSERLLVHPSSNAKPTSKSEVVDGRNKSRSEVKKQSSIVRKPPTKFSADITLSEVPNVPDTISNGEEYTDYGINPFVNSSEDNLSTFSIDVDTASYAIARRKLNEGKLPAYAGIRVEEFINYFDYNYSTDEASPFNVEMETMIHPFKEDRHILRVGLQGMEYSIDNRPPLHLTFLVDVSGSISSQDKLPLAKEAMHMLVDTLHDGDTVALVTYAGNVSRVLSPTHGDSKKKIHSAIERLNSSGSTAMSSGMDIAYEMAWETFEPGAENRVVVLSDGDANVGKTSWTDMLKEVKSYADRGITMSTIGLGMGNYKDTAMEQLANKGDGNNFYIDSRAQAHRVFVEDFNSTMISIARDVKIQMEFNPDVVQSYRLIGYENRDIADKDFRDDKVDAGEVGSGHTVTALYEIALKDGVRQNELAVARVRYEKPGPDSIATERSWTISTAELNEENQASIEMKLAFTAGTFAEILRRSPYVSSLSLNQLIAYGESNQRPGEKDDAELISLMKKAETLGAGPTFVRR